MGDDAAKVPIAIVPDNQYKGRSRRRRKHRSDAIAPLTVYPAFYTYERTHHQADENDIEAQADRFASFLLMPLDDFRKQLTATLVTLDQLGVCAERYGVSLTAMILKWLSVTEEKAVLVVSNDGFMKWAWSSGPAFRAGAFFRTRTNVIPIPEGSLAARVAVSDDRAGMAIPARVWFEHADAGTTVREMKIQSDQYDMVLSLLVLPRFEEFWPSRVTEDD